MPSSYMSGEKKEEKGRNVQRASRSLMRWKRLDMLIEGVAFAVGLLMVAVPAYFMFVEHVREAKRSQ